MGPPGFFSRVRAYGSIQEIGRTTTTTQESRSQDNSQSTTPALPAIVDGPSLAHFLYDKLIKNERADEKIECFYKYAEVGKAAVQWLDNLCSFGFEIEAIYFDGALPVCKRQTRLDRLQKHTENLTKYKQRQASTKRPDRALLKPIRKNLPPPPFLVSAIIESLMESAYAKKTWVVDGEADAFVAAVACSVSAQQLQNKIESYVSIFTSDSDLLIWNTGPRTEIVWIREMTERNTEDGKALDALCFSPRHFDRCAEYQMRDLIKPAFKMRDPKVTFTQAINEGSVDESNHEFILFAAQYHGVYAMTKARYQRKQRENGSEVQLCDPRVSEIVHHYLLAYLRKPELDVHGSTSEAREKQKCIGYKPPTLENNKYAWNEAQVEQEPIDPFDDVHNELSASDNGANRPQPSLILEMFLPALLEDPTKSAAWRIGVPFRNAAESLLMLPFDGHETVVYEYKRSGQTIVPRQVQCASVEDLGENMMAYMTYFQNALSVGEQLDRRSQWKFLVMQLTLSDLHHDGKDQPNLSDAVKVVNGKAFFDWSTVHLFARYQAEYYSLRMLKEIIDFCRGRAEFKRLSLPVVLFDLAEKLNGLPKIAVFFGAEGAGVNEETWTALADEFVKKQKASDS